jgi:hypothetical protein
VLELSYRLRVGLTLSHLLAGEAHFKSLISYATNFG